MRGPLPRFVYFSLERPDVTNCDQPLDDLYQALFAPGFELLIHTFPRQSNKVSQLALRQFDLKADPVRSRPAVAVDERQKRLAQT